MSKLKIGDIVKISDRGEFYSTYTDWAVSQGLTSWEYDRYPTFGENFKVITVAPHLSYKFLGY